MSVKRKPWRRWACVVDGEVKQFSMRGAKKNSCSLHEQVELIELTPELRAVVRAAANHHRMHLGDDSNDVPESEMVKADRALWTAVSRYLRVKGKR